MYHTIQSCRMNAPGSNPRRVFVWGLVAIALTVVASLGFVLVRTTVSAAGGFGRRTEPVVTHDVVLERLKDVAKLVATEMTLRDVVTYENTRLGSTKRVLLVVSGRISAGINMNASAIEIDSLKKLITVTLPPAQILSVDILNVTTYDESSGLLNRFTTDDRDEIQRRIRAQLRESARQSGILEHADQAANKALKDLLSRDGYTADVKRRIELEQPKG
jgi:Protein of unknown function (DUF4230)